MCTGCQADLVLPNCDTCATPELDPSALCLECSNPLLDPGSGCALCKDLDANPLLGCLKTLYVNGDDGSDAGSNNCLDSGNPCATIDHAVGMAMAGNVLSITPTVAGYSIPHITLTFPLSFINADPQVGLVVVSPQAADRLFTIDMATPYKVETVLFDGVEFRDGQVAAGSGGCMQVAHSQGGKGNTLQIVNSLFSNCNAVSGAGGGMYCKTCRYALSHHPQLSTWKMSTLLNTALRR